MVDVLMEKGVTFPAPGTVEIGADVDPDRISGKGVVIHTGCKIFGSTTLIGADCRLGYEAPVTLDNCQLGPQVDLRGGYFSKAVFLQKCVAGLGAHVREGTILEEEANIAHTVGLKQTILFPFVTLGSLINFCDCLMAGGTDRKNHSEVGSSYIHFNYTPNQDKATASLIGDVPQGVMLNQTPIFLGGQGGLVGPCRLAYGTVIAAGTINRKDELRGGRLIFGGAARGGNVPYTPGVYRGEKRIIKNNVVYIGNLIALLRWYEQVRSRFISDDFPQALLDGLKQNLQTGLDERIRRLGELILKMPLRETDTEAEADPYLEQRQALRKAWPRLADHLEACRACSGDPNIRDRFIHVVEKSIQETDNDYITLIKTLKPDEAQTGTQWLQGIVDEVTAGADKVLPFST
jgi:UDP-N-acetylglucosamine/UDP-N-acetylgalactosamine diphosphorylase